MSITNLDVLRENGPDFLFCKALLINKRSWTSAPYLGLLRIIARFSDKAELAWNPAIHRAWSPLINAAKGRGWQH